MKLKFLCWSLVFLCIGGCENFPTQESSVENKKLLEGHVTNNLIHHAPDLSPEKFTHVVLDDTPYYLDGPQQARPQDGFFKKDTQLIIIQNIGSYSLVESSDKIRAYVAESAIKKITA